MARTAQELKAATREIAAVTKQCRKEVRWGDEYHRHAAGIGNHEKEGTSEYWES